VNRLTLALTLLCPTLALAAEPRAVIDAPPRVAPGNVVFLDGSKSASDRPLKWVVVGKPATPFALITFDKDARKNVYALIPNAPEGTHTFALVAVGTTPDGKDLDAAIDVAQVTVGPLTPLPPAPAPDPTPGPTPPPAPTPGPVPSDRTERLGYDYAKALMGAADSAIDAAARGRYDSTNALAVAQRKAFTDALGAAFRPIADDLVKAVGEPSDQPSARDVQAAQDYLKKIQAGVRAAK